VKSSSDSVEAEKTRKREESADKKKKESTTLAVSPKKLKITHVALKGDDEPMDDVSKSVASSRKSPPKKSDRSKKV